MHNRHMDGTDIQSNRAQIRINRKVIKMCLIKELESFASLLFLRVALSLLLLLSLFLIVVVAVVLVTREKLLLLLF